MSIIHSTNKYNDRQRKCRAFSIKEPIATSYLPNISNFTPPSPVSQVSQQISLLYTSLFPDRRGVHPAPLPVVPRPRCRRRLPRFNPLSVSFSKRHPYLRTGNSRKRRKGKRGRCGRSNICQPRFNPLSTC